MSSNIIAITNDTEATAASLLDDATSGSGSGNKSILFFWAEWHAPSNTGGPFDLVVKTLASQNSDGDGDGSIQFYRVLAEDAPKLSRKHNVTTVPTVLFINSDGTVLDRIDGGEDVASVTQFYSKLVNARSTSTSGQPPSVSQTQQDDENLMKEEQSTSTTQDKLNKRLQTIITSSPIVLFQKGTPTDPKCGFSRQAIELLTSANVSFGYFDILQDEEVRQGLKSYSDWPTYPQLYIRGELVGGLDILKEMAEEEGGLVDQLELGEYVIQNAGEELVAHVAAGEKNAPMEGEEEEEDKEKNDQASLNERLKQLITRHRIMLFMKGIPSSPRCGFSRQIVETLDGFNVSYDAFNILEDEQVRQGLKVYSDWPTFPQLYVEGDLLGGLDIVKEMEESGDLEEVLRGTATD